MSRDASADTIIIGAGLSGLTAALMLRDQGQRVVVLEADRRVGGRTKGGVTADGQWLEFGGQWVARAHTHMRALLDRFGLKLIGGATSGRVIDTRPHLSAAERISVQATVARFSDLVASIDLQAPWRTPYADLLDEQTFAGWIRAALPQDGARAHFTAACSALFAPDPREVSLLHAAFYFRSTVLVDALHSVRYEAVDRDAQEWRVDGGPSALCDEMARQLGAAVHTGAVVRTLTQRDSIEVVTQDSTCFFGERVIVTMPPPMAARLAYDPILPSARDQLSQRLHAISVVKMHLVYPTPFWRAAGLSGEVIFGDGPIVAALDNTPPGYSRGVVVGFVEGADSQRLQLNSSGARREAFIGALVETFGSEAANPVEYLEYDWSMDQFTRGCYSGHFPPGAWTSYGPALTTPVGRIHWAGTETASKWTGYMEGAVRSGERAASEVLRAKALQYKEIVDDVGDVVASEVLVGEEPAVQQRPE